MNKQQAPLLRFKEFVGEWEEKTIFELAQDNKLNNGVFNDKNKSGRGYKLINVLDMYLENGIDENTLQLLDLDYDEFLRNKVNYGDVFFTRSSLVKEGIAYSNTYLGNSDDVTYDGHLIKLTPNKNLVNPIFLNYELKTTAVRQQFIIGGKTTTMTTIGQQEIGESIVRLPPLPEQTHLGNFFRRLDNQIAESRAVLEKSRQLKKAMLAKMFPASGEKTPKIRFKGFEGEWETHQIRDLFRITRGYVLAATMLAEKQNQDFCYPVYSSQTKNNGLMGYWKDYLFENAITWTTDGANAGEVNFRSGKFYCTNVCGVLINEDGFSNQCIAEILNLVTRNYVSYVGNPKLMNNVMAEIPILIPPTLKEQTAIGNFFRQLDDTIALQAAEVEKLTQLKKGLLAAMLV